MSDPLATLSPSPARRSFAVAALVALGLITLWLAFARSEPAILAQGILVGIGLMMLFFASRLWLATNVSIILTPEGLFDSTGFVIAPIEQIAKVDRGLFAIKPSNGFVIVTHTSLGRGWAPGLWWRIGRRIGVGGATSAAQSKGMADVLAVILAERQMQG